jgi:ribonuclease HI
MYACCKHGPLHLRTRPRCGFAHQLYQLELPRSIPPYMWRDRSHELGGPSGIDLFIGQEYSKDQLDRVLAMLANEGLYALPGWARQLAWFLGLATQGQYASDADFGWRARMDATGTRIFGNASINVLTDDLQYPFTLMLDDDRMNLVMRMRLRLASADGYQLYVGLADWVDNEDEYTSTTLMLWGAQSRQYLSVVRGTEYYKLGASDCANPWWYMMPRETTGLAHGGWAPPSYFAATGMSITLYEVDVPVLALQDCEYTGILPHCPVSRGLGTCSLYSDGSCNSSMGIAAGWLFLGMYFTGRASLAGGWTGSEAAEILGIVGALSAAYLLSDDFSEVVFCVDSKNAISHVFQMVDPSGMDGKDLWPIITLARMLVQRLRTRVTVLYEKVDRKDNVAHRIAKDEQRRRYDGGWLTGDNNWPQYMHKDWLEVFRMVARNRQSTHKEYALPDDVGDALFA